MHSNVYHFFLQSKHSLGGKKNVLCKLVITCMQSKNSFEALPGKEIKSLLKKVIFVENHNQIKYQQKARSLICTFIDILLQYCAVCNYIHHD